MKVVVGIGNPGPEYVGTRHNVGFAVLDLLAEAERIDVSKKKFLSLTGQIELEGRRVLLMKPQTYVNLSGQAVRQALDWLKTAPDELFVVCDDVNLPLGRLRVRPGGSGGGHKGLESVVQSLGTDQFARLRVGIGSDDRVDRVDYVLGRFSAVERAEMDQACESAARAVVVWATGGIQTCMNQFNAKEPEQKL